MGSRLFHLIGQRNVSRPLNDKLFEPRAIKRMRRTYDHRQEEWGGEEKKKKGDPFGTWVTSRRRVTVNRRDARIFPSTACFPPTHIVIPTTNVFSLYFPIDFFISWRLSLLFLNRRCRKKKGNSSRIEMERESKAFQRGIFKSRTDFSKR